MVTKSEEDSTMTEALGAALEGYLVKPVTPRQVYAAISRHSRGPRIRQQAIARRFVERFRDLQIEPIRGLGWREWIDRYSEVTQWDLDLVAANETGLYESLQGLYPDLRREFALYMKTAYPGWLRNLEGDRPPLSIDIVPEFLLPILKTDKQALFVVIDCLRLDQWRVLEPMHRAAVRHRDDALLQRAAHGDAVLAQRAVQRPLSRRDRGALPRLVGRARGRDAQRARARAARGAARRSSSAKVPVRYEKVSTAAEGDDLERRLARVIAPEGISRVRVQLRRSADARPLGVGDPVRGRARRDRAAPAHAAVVPAVGAVHACCRKRRAAR